MRVWDTYALRILNDEPAQEEVEGYVVGPACEDNRLVGEERRDALKGGNPTAFRQWR